MGTRIAGVFVLLAAFLGGGPSEAADAAYNPVVAEVIDEGFPIPWLSFSYHFGPSRKVANRQSTGGFPRSEDWRPRHR